LKFIITAIIRESPLGVISGKIGQIAGAKWKGINYVRVIPGSVAQPNTDKQLAQRGKFAAAMHFLHPLTEFLKIGWKNFAVKMTAMNAAMSYTVKHAVLGTYPTFTIDYPNVLVSKGNMPGALNQVAASIVAGTVHFTWDDNSDEVGAYATDTTLLVLSNPGKNQAVYFAGLAERADGTQTVTVPNSFSGDLVHCYISFQSVDGFELSNSKYAGAVTAA
jgi:hypothetical protein